MGVLGWIAGKISEATGVEIPEEVTEFADEQAGLDEQVDDLTGDALDDGSLDGGDVPGLIEDYRGEHPSGW